MHIMSEKKKHQTKKTKKKKQQKNKTKNNKNKNRKDNWMQIPHVRTYGIWLKQYIQL